MLATGKWKQFAIRYRERGGKKKVSFDLRFLKPALARQVQGSSAPIFHHGRAGGE